MKKETAPPIPLNEIPESLNVGNFKLKEGDSILVTNQTNTELNGIRVIGKIYK